MRAVLSSAGREGKLIFRNGISIFMVAAPAILALVFILVFGAVNRTTLRLAVDRTVDDAALKKLAYVAQVEQFDDKAALEARVRQMDAVAGVTMQNGMATLVVAGDEGGEFVRSANELVGLALAAPESGVAYRSEAVAARGGLAYDISMICILLMSLFVGGATVGLSIVEERESGVIRAVAVSPLRLGGYVASKLIPALLLGVSGITAAVLIMGRAELLPRFLLLSAASVCVSGMMAFLLGAFASNQLAAVGVLKLLIPVSMILPVSAMFVAGRWQALYYILPMYWQYRAIEAFLNGSPALVPALLTLLVSVPWLAGSVWLFAEKTSLRKGR